MRRATCVASILAPVWAGAQQVADTGYRPSVSAPMFAPRGGPTILLDEAHSNFHTVDGRYAPFVKLLERDGYIVRPNREAFTRATLGTARVLLIANALAKQNEDAWRLPNPSAFTDDEIAAVREWVRGGGSLLLIADHMPFGGAAEKLGLEFGVIFSNGFAIDSSGATGPIRFRRADMSLGKHRILNGRSSRERIDSLTSFTGLAFRITTGGGVPLMTLQRGSTLLMPSVAWQFSDSTPRVRADWMLQGAAIEFGRGRVVVLGEAAMLSAQLAGAQRTPAGMNHPAATQNAQFALNVIHWLTRRF
jgi:hypothetical protein